jgi:hypothetical protein
VPSAAKAMGPGLAVRRDPEAKIEYELNYIGPHVSTHDNNPSDFTVN